MRGNDETPLDAVTGAIATAVDRYVIDKRTDCRIEVSWADIHSRFLF